MAKADQVKFTDLDFYEPSILLMDPYKQRRTPIIATLSDPNVTPVDIQKMMEAGMNVARLKMCNTTKGDKIRLLGKLDKAAHNCCKKYGVHDWPVATCVDLKTCVVRTGLLKEDVRSIPIHESSTIILTRSLSDFDRCTHEKIFVDNPYLTSEAKVGMEISIGQDELILHCIDIIDENSIRCLVSKGGKLSNMDYVSMRGSVRIGPVLKKRDYEIVRFAIEYQVDILIINYVREAKTLKKIKQNVNNKVKKPILIGGICTRQGLDNVDDIAKESDAILLSREFLAYELEPSNRFMLSKIQKWLGAKCQKLGIPFYISGGVFQNSLLYGECSDHEVSDVTNALLDGVHGFVLKDYEDIDNVTETIKYLNELCRSVEPYTNSKSSFWRLIDEIKVPVNAAEACLLSCAAVANQAQAKVIVMPSVTGSTAKLMLRMKPAYLVITVSTKPEVTRMLRSLRCVIPLIYKGPKKEWQLNVEARVNFAVEYGVKRGWLIYGDTYVTLQRAFEESSFCDMVQIWTVTISKKPLVECNDEDGNKIKPMHQI